MLHTFLEHNSTNTDCNTEAILLTIESQLSADLNHFHWLTVRCLLSPFILSNACKKHFPYLVISTRELFTLATCFTSHSAMSSRPHVSLCHVIPASCLTLLGHHCLMSHSAISSPLHVSLCHVIPASCLTLLFHPHLMSHFAMSSPPHVSLCHIIPASCLTLPFHPCLASHFATSSPPHIHIT